MKKLIYKLMLMTAIVYGVVAGVNYFIDPANIYHTATVEKMAAYLNENKIVNVPANIDEGQLQEKRISTLTWQPDTVIIGSSHIMYLTFEYPNLYNAGMSGSYLGDYYGIVGLLKYCDKMPKRVIIGVDPWSFMSSAADGRHSALKKYAEYLTADIGDSDNNGHKQELISPKLKELVSFSYFQASVESYKKNGLRKPEESVNTANDSAIGDVLKIMVDGRRIPSVKQYYSTEEINQEVKQILKKGSIYQLNKGFKDVQKENFAQFEALLQYLQGIGIEVHIYLPAWHPMVYKYFCDTPSFAGVNKVEEAVRKLGHERHIPVHGGYNPSLCNLTEEDFMDWLHLKPEKMLENYKYIK